ncbi:MAG TPA: DUF2892 domain-containing protein [Armatimonadota bacterium]
MTDTPKDSAGSTRRPFFAKNLGPVERMTRAILGVALMAIGFLGFDAQKVNGPGLIFVLLGFLVFLQAPMSWCPYCALQGKCTYERLSDEDEAGSSLSTPEKARAARH